MARTIGQRSKRPLTVEQIKAQREKEAAEAKKTAKVAKKTAVKDGKDDNTSQ